MIVKDSYPFVALFFTGILISMVFHITILVVIFLILLLFVLFFFRDPEREIPSGDNVVSPADGKVIKVKDIEKGPYKKYVAIFMTVFNVHINRSPIKGKIVDYKYFEGKFKPAFDETASIENEHNFITVEGEKIRIMFSQIAGIIARRIVFYKKVGDSLKKGERIGLIKFGSRVDIYLPENVKILVKEGDWVKGGSSIIGEILEE